MSKKNRDYLDEVYNLAISLGIPPAQAQLAAAQSALETGYGKHAPGNAYFGMKAGSSWDGPTQTLRTHEEENGALVAINDEFRVYDDKAASLADWYDRLKVRWPKAAAAGTFEEAMDGLKIGEKGAYATDSKYKSKLANIVGEMTPRPPLNVPGVATSLDTGMSPQRMAGGVAPPPLPRRRPDASLPFDPLPAPPPPVPQSQGIPQAAMFGVRAPGTYKPGNQMAPATAAELSALRPVDTRMQSLIAPQASPAPIVAPFRPMPPVAPTMAETQAEMRPTPGMVRQFPPPPVVRPGAGLGAVAGMGAVAGGANGVAPPNPNMPRYVPPALPRVGPTSPVVPPSPGGFNLGAVLGGLGSNIQGGLTNAGQALTTTASNAIEGTRNAIGTTAQNAGDLLKSELMGTVKGRTLLFNTALGLPAPGSRNPTRYGNTFAERQENARRREAMAYGLPYVPPQTGVRTSLSLRPSSPLPTVPAPRSNRPAPRNTGRWEGVLDEFGMIL